MNFRAARFNIDLSTFISKIDFAIGYEIDWTRRRGTAETRELGDARPRIKQKENV